MSNLPEPSHQNTYNNQHSRGNVSVQGHTNILVLNHGGSSPISDSGTSSTNAAQLYSEPPSPASTQSSVRTTPVPWQNTISPIPQTYVSRPLLEGKIEEQLSESCMPMGLGHATVLYGLAGRGKTQLVRNYLAHHNDQYEKVVWIDCQDSATVIEGFGQFLKQLKVLRPPVDPSLSHTLWRHPYVIALYAYLNNVKAQRQWLLVFDDLSVDQVKIVPQSLYCTALITTQNLPVHPALSNRGTWLKMPALALQDLTQSMWSCPLLHVKGFSRKEAQALILKRFSISQDVAHALPFAIAEHCSTIAKVLGNTAFVIDLAGGFILNTYSGEKHQAGVKTHQDWDFLVQCLEWFIGDLHKKCHPIWTKTTLNYGETLDSMYDSVLTALRVESEGVAYHLLLFLSRFTRKSMPKALFERASTAHPDWLEVLPDWLSELILVTTQSPGSGKRWITFRYTEAVRILLNYDLIKHVKDPRGNVSEYWVGNCINALVYRKANTLVTGTDLCDMNRHQDNFLRAVQSVPTGLHDFQDMLESHCVYAEYLREDHADHCESCFWLEPLSTDGWDKRFHSASTYESYGSSPQEWEDS